MKTKLLLLVLLVAVMQAVAQTVTPPSGAGLHDIRLYRATVKTMSGEKISGIFYALTDSTLVFFANKRAAIEQFRAGQLPELDTIRTSDIKRIDVHRKGQFLKGTLVGLGVSALLITPLFTSTPTNGLDALGLIAVIGLSPLSLAIGLVFGTVPRESERINSKPARFQRIHNRLSQYTIANQQQRLSIRTHLIR